MQQTIQILGTELNSSVMNQIYRELESDDNIIRQNENIKLSIEDESGNNLKMSPEVIVALIGGGASIVVELIKSIISIWVKSKVNNRKNNNYIEFEMELENIKISLENIHESGKIQMMIKNGENVQNIRLGKYDE